MAKTEPFEVYFLEYDEWFEKNRFVYLSELAAVKRLLPKKGRGLEIGVGSGRFALPLGIKIGVEPAKRMRELAAKRGIEVIEGVAENLPFPDAQFDFALMVTTICFLNDVEKSFQEASRVLKPGGALIIGFIDKKSPIGQLYEQKKKESPFYKLATFYSVSEVLSHLTKAGFKDFRFIQTIFHNLSEIREIEPIKEGYGEGSFVVVKAIK